MAPTPPKRRPSSPRPRGSGAADAFVDAAAEMVERGRAAQRAIDALGAGAPKPSAEARTVQMFERVADVAGDVATTAEARAMYAYGRGTTDAQAVLALEALEAARVALCDAIAWVGGMHPTRSRVARLATYQTARQRVEKAMDLLRVVKP